MQDKVQLCELFIFQDSHNRTLSCIISAILWKTATNTLTVEWRPLNAAPLNAPMTNR